MFSITVTLCQGKAGIGKKSIVFLNLKAFDVVTEKIDRKIVV